MALEAILYVNDFPNTNNQFYSNHLFYSQAFGVRLLVHPRGTYPSVTQDAFDIPPGHTVRIDLDATKYKRAPEPYSKCSDEHYLEDLSGLTQRQRSSVIPYKYTDLAARQLCWQKSCIEQCSCFDPYLPMTTAVQLDHVNLRRCTQFEIENGTVVNFMDTYNQILCFWKHYDTLYSMVGKDDPCHFEIPCSEYAYKKEVFQSTWPHHSKYRIYETDTNLRYTATR